MNIRTGDKVIYCSKSDGDIAGTLEGICVDDEGKVKMQFVTETGIRFAITDPSRIRPYAEAYRLETNIEDGVVAMTLFKGNTVIAKHHAHILKAGDGAVAQAISYAGRRIWNAVCPELDTFKKERNHVYSEKRFDD